jgi:hypothetical protein
LTGPARQEQDGAGRRHEHRHHTGSTRASRDRSRTRAAHSGTGEAARQLPADLVMDIANARLFKVAVSKAEGVFDRDTPRRRPNGDQEVRIAYFYPKSGARIIDTWDVSGMRGTGSHDIEVHDLFVPDEHTYSAILGLESNSPLF